MTTRRSLRLFPRLPPLRSLTPRTFVGLGLLVAGGCYSPPNVTVYPGEAGVDSTKLVGEGRLSHAPEFIELEIQISSQCYATPIEAVNATDAAVAKVMELLADQIDPNNDKDGVFSRGGYTQPFSRYDSPSGQYFCQGTFQKSSTVVLKTSKVDSFSQDFAKIQDIVFTTMSGPSDPKLEQGVTFATAGTPAPQLYYETRERLEQEALADALDNAQQKFESTAHAVCEDTDYRVLKFIEHSPDDGRPIAYGAAPSGASGGGGAVGFDAIWINKVLDVFFVIESECGKR